MEGRSSDLTQILVDSSSAQPADVAKRLMPLVYDELRHLAERYLRSERRGHTLQPTALVHEAFMRLVDQDNPAYKDRGHFFAVAAKAMRQILTDHARRNKAAKRGGDWQRVTLDAAVSPMDALEIDVLALDEALTKLGELDQRQSKIVELRFFAGLTVDETAQIIEVSPRTVELDWRLARAWLKRELSGEA